MPTPKPITVVWNMMTGQFWGVKVGGVSILEPQRLVDEWEGYFLKENVLGFPPCGYSC